MFLIVSLMCVPQENVSFRLLSVATVVRACMLQKHYLKSVYYYMPIVRWPRIRVRVWLDIFCAAPFLLEEIFLLTISIVCKVLLADMAWQLWKFSVPLKTHCSILYLVGLLPVSISSTVVVTFGLKTLFCCFGSTVRWMTNLSLCFKQLGLCTKALLARRIVLGIRQCIRPSVAKNTPERLGMVMRKHSRRVFRD